MNYNKINRNTIKCVFCRHNTLTKNTSAYVIQKLLHVLTIIQKFRTLAMPSVWAMTRDR